MRRKLVLKITLILFLSLFTVIPVKNALAQLFCSGSGNCQCIPTLGGPYRGLCEPYCGVFNCPAAIGADGSECNATEERVCNVCNRLYDAFESSEQAIINNITC